MPIGITNSLLSLSLILGLLDDEGKMRMIVDTRTVTSTCNFDFQMWVMSQCPDIVDDFCNMTRVLLMMSSTF